MTKDEERFYLREIHPYWTTPHISADKVQELEKSRLVEKSEDAVPTVRLTREGQRVKAASRPQSRPSRVQSVRSAPARRAPRRNTSGPVKGLV